jgi:hypothetical protein
MYLKNLLNITGRSPAKMIDLNASKALKRNKKELAYKGSRFSIAAFLLLTAIMVGGCDSSGSVGEGLGPDEDSVNKTVLNLESLETVSSNTFSGRLQRSPMGYFEDPLYGTINAVALLKPTISRAQVDTIREGDTMSLKMHFSTVSNGVEGGVSNFEIYEVGELWRGNQLRYNSEISVDFANKVGEFQLTDEDSIEVELSDDWVQKLRVIFDAPTAERDSLYRSEFTGLAIVPSETNQRIHYLRHSQEDEDDSSVTRFLVYSDPPDENGENGDNGDENGDDEGPVIRTLGLLDWGSSVVRSNEPESTDGIVLHNSERVLRVEVNIPKEELNTRNIVNAKLIFGLRTDVELANPGIIRPPVESIRGHSFNPVPNDLTSELFINTPRFNASIDEDVNTFRLDVTQYVLNEVYGDGDEGSIFVSLQAINGFLYSAHLFDETAAEEAMRPRIVITSVD